MKSRDKVFEDSSVSKGIEEVRNGLVNMAILAFVIFGLPALVSSLLRAKEAGWQNIMFFHIGAYFFVLGTALLRRRLSVRLKTLIILIFLFSLGIAGLLTWGLTGMGVPFLITASIIAAILMGTRSGILLLGAGLAVIAVVGAGVCTGTIVFHFDVAEYAVSPGSWLTALLASGLFTAIVVMSLGRLQGYLTHSADAMAYHARGIKNDYAELQDEMADRKRVEDALRQNEEKYRALFENMRSCAAVYEAVDGGEDFLIRDFNRAAEETEGISREEVLGKSVLEVFPGVKELGLFDVFQRVWKTGKSEHHPVSEYKDERISGWRDNFVYRLPSGEVVAVYSDETKARQTEEEIIKNERYFRSLLQHLHEDVMVIAPDYRITDINDTFLVATGKSREDIIGRHCYEISHGFSEPCDKKGEDCRIRQVFQAGKPRMCTHEHLRVDGSKIWVDILLSPLKDETGKVTHVIETARDVTDLIEARERMNESEARYRALFQGAAEGILVADIENREFQYANPAVCEMLGYNEEELKGMSVGDIHPEEALENVTAEFQTQAQGENVLASNIPCLRKDGSVIFADINATKVVIEERECNVGFFTDVTERMRTEETLHENQRRLATLMSNLPGMAYRCRNDPDWTMEFLSDGCRSLTGYGPEKLIGNASLSYGEVIHPEDRSIVWHRIQDALGEKRAFQLVYRIITANGEEKWVWEQGRGVFDESGEVKTIEGFMLDITEQKKAQDELHKNESLLNEVGSIAKIGGWEMDLITHEAKWTRGTYEIVEIAQDNPVPGPEEHVSYYLPEYRPIVEESMRRLIEEDIPLEFEARLETAKGNIKWCRALGRGIREGGECVKLYGTFQDITERKRAEEERDRILSLSKDLICIAGMDGFFKYVNPAWEQVLGYSTQELLSRPFLDFIYPDDHEPSDAEVARLSEGLKTVDFENRYVCRDGSIRHILWKAIPLSEEKLIYAIGRDITERKHAEDVIRESEEKLRLTIDNSPLGVGTVDPMGNYISTNHTYEKMLGYSKEELREMSLFDVTHPDDRPENRKLFGDMISSKTSAFNMEKRCIRKDGNIINVLIHAGGIRDAEGKLMFGLAFMEDITDRKQAEKELKKYRDKLEKMVEERTRELEKRNAELERMHELFVGREFRIKELRDKIRELEERQGIE